jgi:hypothetical protein
LQEPSLSYRIKIEREFNRRKAKNKNYSLRAYARDLRLTISVLSPLLSRSRHLGRKNLLEVAKALRWSSKEFQDACREISYDRGANRKTPKQSPPRKRIRRIPSSVFEQISDWYYFAILSLASLKDHSADANWIAGRLGITAQQASNALST